MAGLLVLVGRERLLVGRLGLLVLVGRLVDRGMLLVTRLGLLVRGLERNMSELQKVNKLALPAGQLWVEEQSWSRPVSRHLLEGWWTGSWWLKG